jgi:uncharacterized membrane protein YkvA (DUF1232 family)
MKFFPNPIQGLLRKLLAHPQYRWWIAAATLLYLVSPIDILPDAIPFLGEIDDAMIVSLLLAELSPLVIEKLKTFKQSKNTQETNQA